MADYLQYLIRPMQHILDVSSPALNQPFPFAAWPSQNCKLNQKSIQKRQGYIEDRDLGSGVDIQAIVFFQLGSGTTHTIYLTDTNACKRESDGTWSYITETYTTGDITGISSAVVTGDASVDWATGSINPAIGDYFIMDADLSSANEPDSDWAKIKAVNSDTQITLVDNYRGATGSGGYTIRRIYSVPTNERWNYAIINDKLIFTNGNVDVQSYTGSGVASALDSTNAVKAKYCIEYADRAVLADLYISGSREAFTVKWSKNGDPTNWIDSTSGSNDLLDTEDFITGLGKVGADLVVYKSDSLALGHQTANPEAPISFSREERGIGTPAPYSIVPALGTNVFVGRDDFYILDGSHPVSIGESIRYKFFDLISPTEVKRIYGYNNALQNEVRWFMTDTDNNRRCFVWDYKRREWTHYMYHHRMSCGGKGEL